MAMDIALENGEFEGSMIISDDYQFLHGILKDGKRKYEVKILPHSGVINFSEYRIVIDYYDNGLYDVMIMKNFKIAGTPRMVSKYAKLLSKKIESFEIKFWNDILIGGQKLSEEEMKELGKIYYHSRNYNSLYKKMAKIREKVFSN